MISSRNNSDIPQNEADNLAWFALRIDIKDKRGPCGCTNLFQEAKQQRRLTHSGWRDQRNKTAVARIAVLERCKGFAMRGTFVHASGIWAGPERIISKSVIS